MKQPWSPPEATRRIRELACSDLCRVAWTKHARERLHERNLIAGDVLHVLRNGFVHAAPRPGSRPDLCKYLVEALSPNSEGRTVGVVVIPDPAAWGGAGCLKIITVMWVDE